MIQSESIAKCFESPYIIISDTSEHQNSPWIDYAGQHLQSRLNCAVDIDLSPRIKHWQVFFEAN